MAFALAMVLLCVAAVSAARVLQQTDPVAFPGASPAEQATQEQAGPRLTSNVTYCMAQCYATTTQEVRFELMPCCCRC